MKINLYNFLKYTCITFNVIPTITIGYDKQSAKSKFSIYFAWLFFGLEIY